MPYLNCPRCKLSIRIHNANLAMDRCPRCLARSGRVAHLQLADRPLSARGSGRGSSSLVGPRPTGDERSQLRS
jgi:hypothetical protein